MKTHKRMQRPPQSSQAGFTLIESLLAILVVTILLVGLTPFFALAVANRVQARRVELATQAAKTYIDGVKSGAIIPPPMTSGTLTSFPFPTQTALNCTNANDYCPTQSPTQTNPNSTTVYYCVPGEGHPTCNTNNFKDMIIQAFGQISSTDVAKGYRSYRLGVRVYRADAFDPSTPRTFTVTPGTTQSSFTGGTGLTVGKSQAPLVEMTTEMSVSDPTEFKSLCASANVTGC